MTGANDGQTPKARLLGAELRELRENAGMTVRGLAAQLDVAPGTVSRHERGERAPKTEYVARVLGTLGVTGDRYDEIIEFAEKATEPNMIAGPKGLHRHLIELSEFDRSADRVLHVAPLLVPGPMQTRAYATEMMASLPAEERDVRVELRMARVAALTTPSHVEVEVIIAERALREPIGGQKVMAEQVRHLHSLSQESNITIRLLPSLTHWTLAHNGAFVLYEFPKASPIVHLEHYRGPAFLYDDRDVQAYRDAAATLPNVAMSPGKSADLMAEIAEELERS